MSPQDFIFSSSISKIFYSYRFHIIVSHSQFVISSVEIMLTLPPKRHADLILEYGGRLGIL